jgi:hypothetical protein
VERYSRRQLIYILDNYWLLREGHIPLDNNARVGQSHRSPFESAAIWISDVDMALSKLDTAHPDNWLKISVAITEPKLRKLIHDLGLTPRQKCIIRYFMLNEEKLGSRVDGVLWNMLKILNSPAISDGA